MLILFTHCGFVNCSANQKVVSRITSFNFFFFFKHVDNVKHNLAHKLEKMWHLVWKLRMLFRVVHFICMVALRGYTMVSR